MTPEVEGGVENEGQYLNPYLNDENGAIKLRNNAPCRKRLPDALLIFSHFLKQIYFLNKYNILFIFYVDKLA